MMTLRWVRHTLLCSAIVLGLPGTLGDVQAMQRPESTLVAQPPPAIQNKQATPVMHVSTTELPPFSMDQPAGARGALVEMVEELAKRTGATANIQFVPWRRALFLTTSRTRSAVFPLTRSPEREAQYRWLAPLYRENFVFITVKGAAVNSLSPTLGKSARIAILRGSLMVKFLHEQGYPNIVEASSVDEGVRFLQRGIVEAVCGDLEILQATLGDRLRTHHVISDTVRETSTWLGGSLDFTEADALRFEEAMKSMIGDGSYASIVKKYKLGTGL
jgi:ABC-type amino acid transport substrate-binding protein